MRKIGVAILGVGTVGGGAYKILTKNKKMFKDTYSIDVNVVSILDVNAEQMDKLKVPAEIRANSIYEVVSNPEVDIICELIGGDKVALDFVRIALKSGKTVVTANKEMLSKHFIELHDLAYENNCGLYYEASVMGGTPVIRAISESMQGNNILKVEGIINGTTNYILSKMEKEGMSFDQALLRAQTKGYAEKNPTNDVDGFDAMYKLSILAMLAFKGYVDYNDIVRIGIRDIKKEDMEVVKEFGYTLKLLAIAKRDGDSIEVRVHPTLVKDDNTVIVNNTYNALKVVGDSVGELMFTGKGAGSIPTGSAVVSDVLFASRFILNQNHYYITKTKAWQENKFEVNKDFECKYYIRIAVNDKPGVLAKVSSVFADYKVSLSEVVQKQGKPNEPVSIIVTTHLTKESDIKKALDMLNDLKEVVDVESMFRIEE